jgi:DNA gyrase subunit A
MGRNTQGVKGIKLRGADYVVGMVVAMPELDLLTVCENGFGKRTPIGVVEDVPVEGENGAIEDEVAAPEEAVEDVPVTENPSDEEAGEEASTASGMKYRRQRRGGLGVKDIRTSDRNGKVVDIAVVADTDEVMMVTSNGIIQRIRVSDIRRIGRNTQGVRIIRLDEGDKLVSLAPVPREEEVVGAAEPPPSV